MELGGTVQHIDISYLNVAGTFYYLCSILDGCSRVIVHWEVREAMKEADIERLIERARELHPGVSPRIISDNGPQFIAGDFKNYIRLTGMTLLPAVERSRATPSASRTRPRSRRPAASSPPSSTSTTTTACTSAIDYVNPADHLAGRHEVIAAARDAKLESARERRAAWRQGARAQASQTPSSPTPLACSP